VSKDKVAVVVTEIRENIQSALTQFTGLIATSNQLVGRQLAVEQQKGQRRNFELRRLNAAVCRLHNRLKRKSEDCVSLQRLLEEHAPDALHAWIEEQKLSHPRRRRKLVDPISEGSQCAS